MMMIGREADIRSKRLHRGITLVELLMGLAILVVLAGIGGYQYLSHANRAKRDAVKVQLAKLTQAAQAYREKHGEYPSSLLRLAVPESERPYVAEDELKTPWGAEYQYDPQGHNNGGNRPDVWAESPDGVIGNW
jgi:general secretion pathway protein G